MAGKVKTFLSHHSSSSQTPLPPVTRKMFNTLSSAISSVSCQLQPLIFLCVWFSFLPSLFAVFLSPTVLVVGPPPNFFSLKLTVLVSTEYRSHYFLSSPSLPPHSLHSGDEISSFLWPLRPPLLCLSHPQPLLLLLLLLLISQ